jgi:hypothetical protein
MMKRSAAFFRLVILVLMACVNVQDAISAEGFVCLSNDPVEIDSSLKKDYRTAFLMVYNKLDDLHECDIKLKGKKLKTTMAARPTFFSFFRRKDKRKYVIVYNNDPDFKGVKPYDVPEQARVGLFAHELMHVRDYQSLSFGGLVKRGWQYMSKRGKRNLEHRIDSMTIAAGFGEELFYWSYFVLFDSYATAGYKMFKRDVYLTPKDILNSMEEKDFAEHYDLDLN